MIKKTKLLIIALLLLFVSIGAVCAQENVTADDIAGTDNIDDVDDAVDVETPKLGQEQTGEVLSDDSVGNFTELSDLISSSAADSTINLTKDYKYVSGDKVYSSGISINKKLTINGNGHTINASDCVAIFSVSASDVVLKNITFTNGYASYMGAAISASGNNFKIMDSVFKDSKTTLAVVYTSGSYASIINSTFINNKGEGAVALYSYGYNHKVIDCKFIDNMATRQYAAAIFLRGDQGRITNSEFIHNVANTTSDQRYPDGGAIYIFGNYATIDGCNFTDNIQLKTGGGALYCGGFYGTLKNCNFINNSAPMSHGGGVSILGGGWTISNTYFENNTAATAGGGLYHNAVWGTLYNLTFVNNSAHMGGGAHLSYDYYRVTDMNYAYTTLSDSRFINNHAIYGGGALNTISHVNVDNCEFIDNSANNYGGALSIGFSNITNSRFINNTAPYGGAVFSYASGVTDSNFTDNNANFGNSVYVVTKSYLNNNSGDDDAFSKPAIDGGQITGSHDVEHMLETEAGYYGFCSELYNFNPYTGVYDDTMDFIKNSINGEPVKEYLKILIYRFLDNFEDLKQTGFHNYVWAFTDREYWNSDDPIVQSVIELYDSGFRVPSANACKVLPNGTLMYINYSSMVTPSSQQNLFLFKFAYGEEINQVFTKDAIINKTIYIGDTVDYRLVINNKGNLPVYDNWVEDKEHSDGLVYQSWRAEVGNWTYNEQLHRWYLDVLEPGRSASIILTFGVTLEGLLINNATSGLGDKNVNNSAAGLKAENPNMTVKKKTITPQVNISDLAIFEIVVTNTGDVDLNNVFVCESEFDSELVYVDFTSKVGTWRHSVNKEGKHVFTLAEVLELEDSASFRVFFNTTKAGNFSNTVTAGFNDTTLSNSTNTTEVIGNDTPVVPSNETNGTNGTNETKETVDITPVEPTDNDTADGEVDDEISETPPPEDRRKAVSKHPVDEKATGNPLLALMLALILIPIRRFKK
ncbi:pectate lyase-like adhesive domain-containing protein [Methanobrevibacter sp. UBA212]|uniref:pectate lyase-like adhesive domain-containing protein n=1 Tax=Methanobrevibacter sp. UBA212 TaxID=1915476 RepID=UPI0025EDB92A|nr:pectate lyase-like adhesive domain-containing protein [Methanobrevibacter sp. UBA212]